VVVKLNLVAPSVADFEFGKWRDAEIESLSKPNAP
jgi:hypothetical protein